MEEKSWKTELENIITRINYDLYEEKVNPPAPPSPTASEKRNDEIGASSEFLSFPFTPKPLSELNSKPAPSSMPSRIRPSVSLHKTVTSLPMVPIDVEKSEADPLLHIPLDLFESTIEQIKTDFMKKVTRNGEVINEMKKQLEEERTSKERLFRELRKAQQSLEKVTRNITSMEEGEKLRNSNFLEMHRNLEKISRWRLIAEPKLHTMDETIDDMVLCIENKASLEDVKKIINARKNAEEHKNNVTEIRGIVPAVGFKQGPPSGSDNATERIEEKLEKKMRAELATKLELLEARMNEKVANLDKKIAWKFLEEQKSLDKRVIETQDLTLRYITSSPKNRNAPIYFEGNSEYANSFHNVNREEVNADFQRMKEALLKLTNRLITVEKDVKESNRSAYGSDRILNISEVRSMIDRTLVDMGILGFDDNESNENVLSASERILVETKELIETSKLESLKEIEGIRKLINTNENSKMLSEIEPILEEKIKESVLENVKGIISEKFKSLEEKIGKIMLKKTNEIISEKCLSLEEQIRESSYGKPNDTASEVLKLRQELDWIKAEVTTFHDSISSISSQVNQIKTSVFEEYCVQLKEIDTECTSLTKRNDKILADLSLIKQTNTHFKDAIQGLTNQMKLCSKTENVLALKSMVKELEEKISRIERSNISIQTVQKQAENELREARARALSKSGSKTNSAGTIPEVVTTSASSSLIKTKTFPVDTLSTIDSAKSLKTKTPEQIEKERKRQEELAAVRKRLEAFEKKWKQNQIQRIKPGVNSNESILKTESCSPSSSESERNLLSGASYTANSPKTKRPLSVKPMPPPPPSVPPPPPPPPPPPRENNVPNHNYGTKNPNVEKSSSDSEDDTDSTSGISDKVLKQEGENAKKNDHLQIKSWEESLDEAVKLHEQREEDENTENETKEQNESRKGNDINLNSIIKDPPPNTATNPNSRLRASGSTLPCKYCGRQLPGKNTAALHERVCDKKPESCKYCNNRFSVKDLKSHESSCVAKEMEKLATCTYCDEEFPVGELEQHEKTCDWIPDKCIHCGMVIIARDIAKHQSRCSSSPSNKIRSQALSQLSKSEPSIEKWSEAQVSEWIETTLPSIAKVFKGHKIDGQRLLDINENDLETTYGVALKSDRIKFFNEFNKLTS